jgi:two-component system, cell cycle response regulator
LFFIDIDDMKWINDTFGHREGDKALLNSATVLNETFRESDIIGRIGGDEFAILAFDTTEMTPELIKSRLQNQLDIHNAQSCLYKLSLSIGISYYDPADPISIDELMSKADSLMYEHKRARQNS